MKDNNDWAGFLVAARQSRVDKVPPEWEPIWAIAKKVELTTSAVRDEINKALGKTVERKKFVIQNPSGKIASTYHYRRIK